MRDATEPPVLVGHSMGSLVVQLLLAQGLGACGVAIDSAPPKGVSSAKWSFLKSNWPVISPFVDEDQPVLLTQDQFAYSFVHTLSPEQQKAVYDVHVVPESRHVGRAPVGAEAKVDFSKAHAPLLFVAGAVDRIIPASLNRSNFKKYTHNDSVTEIREFPNRTHYIIGQDGWTEVADHVKAWIEKR